METIHITLARKPELHELRVALCGKNYVIGHYIYDVVWAFNQPNQYERQCEACVMLLLLASTEKR
jgi:hypothetical protein